jgi:hypothetical protein
MLEALEIDRIGVLRPEGSEPRASFGIALLRTEDLDREHFALGCKHAARKAPLVLIEQAQGLGRPFARELPGALQEAGFVQGERAAHRGTLAVLGACISR